MAFFSVFPGNVLLTLLIAMVPVLELRAAIPLGVANGLPIWVAVAVAVVGNLLPAPFILLFVRRVFAFLRSKLPKMDRFVTKLEKRAEAKSKTVLRWSFWGLFLLVAIPLPGTGAWTGALVAAMLELRLKNAMPAIALGVLAAGIIVGMATVGVVQLL